MIDFIAPEMEFTGFMFATILFLFAAMFLVIRNKVLAHDPRNTFVVTLATVAVITLIDWFNYLSVGHPDFVWFQRISMAVSFTVAPTLPVLVAHTLADDPVPFKVVVAIIALQGLLELATIFGGYVFYVDANNYYHRGPLYGLYTLTYIVSALYLTKQVIVIGTTYQTASLWSMLIILVVFFAGVTIQIPFPNVRITWLCTSMSVVLFILFYIEMVITADPLTMLLNRTVYNRFLESPTLPFTYVILDVNRFKQVNDTYGHAFGDLCLKTLSQEILKTYAPYGRCYRIGGDEFAVILTSKNSDPEALENEVRNRVDVVRQTDERIPTLSIGHATAGPECPNVNAVIELADQHMYLNKRNSRRQQ